MSRSPLFVFLADSKSRLIQTGEDLRAAAPRHSQTIPDTHRAPRYAGGGGDGDGGDGVGDDGDGGGDDRG